uniref:Uncharacterized protein n=1 Tax=Manihot esculenta TaxID=3983 RepID=A0A2C9UP54_MANES
MTVYKRAVYRCHKKCSEQFFFPPSSSSIKRQAFDLLLPLTVSWILMIFFEHLLIWICNEIYAIYMKLISLALWCKIHWNILVFAIREYFCIKNEVAITLSICRIFLISSMVATC